jgi:hypothetical protein
MRHGNLGRQFMTTDREERIRQLAHEIWEREGHPDGRDAEHWRMATDAYEAELAGARMDDAGQPLEVGLQSAQERTMGAPAALSGGAAATQPITSEPATTRKRRTKAEMEAARATEEAGPVARRARKDQEVSASMVTETTPASKRKRRTKAEMAAAAGVAGAAAAVMATVAVTKRRREARTKTSGDAAPAPAADVALRGPRRAKSKAKLSEADSAPVAAARDTITSAVPDPSAVEPSDLATSLMPDPGAEPPSDMAIEPSSSSAPLADPSSGRVAN